ncbi:hypothetical protein AAMO2058_000329400 [Amorphochlora amoebiformis]|eukprot:1386723-Amorphochlora_amoeboformis.AAC.1
MAEIRTRGLVVAALLSVASFSGAEKSSGRIQKSEHVVDTIKESSDWGHISDREQAKTCKFLPNAVSGTKTHEDCESDPRVPRRLRGNKLWQICKQRNDVSRARRVKNSKKSNKGGGVPDADFKLSARVFETSLVESAFSTPKLKRKVSWGKNTYYETHSGDEYDRTSYPDPYDTSSGDQDTFDQPKFAMNFLSRPIGLSIIFLYLAMLVAVSSPTSMFS